MSATYTAGQKVRAVDAVPQALWTIASTTGTSSVGTTETTVLSAPASTYRAGRAYRLEFRGLYRCLLGAATISVCIRDTNASGTVRMLKVADSLGSFNLNYHRTWEHYIANTGATDITGRVLALTLQSSSGTNTVLINAGAEMPLYLACIEIGAATDFPQAVAL